MPIDEKTGRRINRLTEDKRREVLASYISTGNQQQTARECGVSPSSVNKIVRENRSEIDNARRDKTVRVVQAVVEHDAQKESKDLLAMRSIARGSANLHLGRLRDIGEMTARLNAMDPDDPTQEQDRVKLRAAISSATTEYLKCVPLREIREVDAHIHNKLNANAPTMAEWAKIYDSTIAMIEECPNEEAKFYFGERWLALIQEIGLQRRARQEEA